MIVRHFIQCATCKHAITLRIQMGGEKVHDHRFACPKCGEEIAMRVSAENAFDIKIEPLTNAENSKIEGQVVNLAADFLIRKEHLHTDTYFPAMEHMYRVLEKVPLDQMQMPEAVLESLKQGTPPPLPPGLLDDWPSIRKGWRLLDRGQVELAQQQLSKYSGPGMEEPKDLPNVLFNFSQRLIAPEAIKRFSNAAAQLQGIAENGGREYSRFIEFYGKKWRADHLARYQEIFSEYFQGFHDFNQTLIYARIDIELPKGLIAKSVGFDRTRMFYGNAFEAHGTNIAILGCLNNLRLGRPFDQFEKMDLRKYLGINKAGRVNPFESFEPFFHLADEYDSTIRNASHHGWLRLDKAGENLEYRSGGTGAVHHMSYAEYLLRCNRLFVNFVALLCVELVLANSAGLT